MNVVDANVLLYAVNEATPHHEESRRWLADALSGSSTVAFSWVALLAFIRLSTKAGLFPSPLPVDVALDMVREWLAQPTAVVVEPTSRHIEVLAGLLEPIGAGGNLTNDAHLAALAIEHRGQVISYDSDFARFKGVVWRTPASA